MKFNPNGVLINNFNETKTESVKEAELLQVIKDYIKSNFANFSIASAEKKQSEL